MKREPSCRPRVQYPTLFTSYISIYIYDDHSKCSKRLPERRSIAEKCRSSKRIALLIKLEKLIPISVLISMQVTVSISYNNYHYILSVFNYSPYCCVGLVSLLWFMACKLSWIIKNQSSPRCRIVVVLFNPWLAR